MTGVVNGLRVEQEDGWRAGNETREHHVAFLMRVLEWSLGWEDVVSHLHSWRRRGPVTG